MYKYAKVSYKFKKLKKSNRSLSTIGGNREMDQ